MQESSHPPYRYIAPHTRPQPKLPDAAHPSAYQGINLDHVERAALRAHDVEWALLGVDCSGSAKSTLDEIRQEARELMARIEAFATSLRVSG
jgi:hypothetical protein